MTRLALALIPLCLATAVAAHSPLQTVSPAPQSVQDAMPETLDMTFTGPMRLTRVQIMRDDMDPVDLEVPAGGFETDYSIGLGAFGPGDYTILWRGLSEDGHPLLGDVTFTVD